MVVDTRTPAAMIALAVTSGIAGAGDDSRIEVIFSAVPQHPTAMVPGARDAGGNPVPAEFISIDWLGFHPDGSEWAITARNSLGVNLQATLVHGAGTTGTVLAQEGQPLDDGAPGELYDYFGIYSVSFNDLGQIAFIAHARGGDPGRAQKAMVFDGAGFSVVHEQGDAALGMLDDPPENSGDEVLGATFGSIHLQNDGTVGFLDPNVQNVANARRHGAFYGDTVFAQIGVTPIEDGTWTSFNGNHFWTTPDGSTWMLKGEDDAPFVEDQILVVNGAVMLRQNHPINGSPWVIETIFHSRLHACGDVFARGSRDDPGDWAARNTEVLTQQGDPTGDGDELLTERFFSVAGNVHGDWVVASSTDDPDPARDHVIIRNGPEVIVREGDMVDLNGDGLPNDDAFIGRGDPTLIPWPIESMHLTDDGVLYFIASLRDGAGFDLLPGGADALLRMSLAGCPADIDGSGTVDIVDLLALLVAWGPCSGCPEDIDGNGTVDIADLLELLIGVG